jgi:hypothetical protein
MTLVEGIIGMVASVVTVLIGVGILVRYIRKSFENWAGVVIENSKAVHDLSTRVTALEGTLKEIG